MWLSKSARRWCTVSKWKEVGLNRTDPAYRPGVLISRVLWIRGGVIWAGRRGAAGKEITWCLRNTPSWRVFTWYQHGSRMKIDSAVFHAYSSFSRGARHSRECTQRTFRQIANNSQQLPSTIFPCVGTRGNFPTYCAVACSVWRVADPYPDASTSTGFPFPIPQYPARSCSKRWPEVRG